MLLEKHLQVCRILTDEIYLQLNSRLLDGQPGQPNKYGKAIRSLIMCNMIVIWFKPNKYLQLGIVLGKQMNGLSCWLYHIN
jgi:hypothetical protein